jgi:hypothetical protein
MDLWIIIGYRGHRSVFESATDSLELVDCPNGNWVVGGLPFGIVDNFISAIDKRQRTSTVTTQFVFVS